MGAAERAVLIWSGPDGEERLAAHAQRLGVAAAFFLPRTPNARGIAEAWAAASDAEPPHESESPRLLVISGDEALVDPNVRALAEQADKVLAIAMFERAARGIADLVLPATSYLERDGTYVNLEGRLQRLRRTVIPPAPDELAWVAKLADRFGVHVSPYPSQVFEELSQIAYGGMSYGDIGDQAPLRPRTAPPQELQPPPRERRTRGLRLVAYRPLFSGPAVERIPELQFQRPRAELELSRDDARRLGVSTGDDVTVQSNGTSVRLRARVSRAVRKGVVRAAVEHAGGLEGPVEVST